MASIRTVHQSSLLMRLNIQLRADDGGERPAGDLPSAEWVLHAEVELLRSGRSIPLRCSAPRDPPWSLSTRPRSNAFGVVVSGTASA